MAKCKYCQADMEWGRDDERWVPLVPVGADEGLERKYVDENGVLRAMHHLVCIGREPAVRITRLARPVTPGPVKPAPEKEGFTLFVRKKRKKKEPA